MVIYSRKLNKISGVFTLIELLIVIAIIAILASMLLPGLKRARESAKRIACVNNLKQMNTGMLMYFDAYNGWIMCGNLPGGPYWFHEVNYLITGKDIPCYGSANFKHYGLFKCPSEPIGFGFYSDGLYSYTHYGINTELAGTEELTNKISSVKEPTRTILLGDSAVQSTYALHYGVWLGCRHGSEHPAGIGNILYFDGHVEGLKRSDISAGSSDFKIGF